MKGTNKMELYRLTEDMRRAIQIYQDAETDEQLALAETTLTSVEIPFQAKAVAVAHHILNVEADATAIESELQRLGGLLIRAKKQSEWFRKYLLSAMESVNSEKIESATLKLSLRKSSAVIVDDESKVPMKYKRVIPQRLEIDKNAIKADSKLGIGVDGVHIEERKSLQIK
jgi:Siphovirus Gp157